MFSGSLLTMVDNRVASVPSLRVNSSQLISGNQDDIESIEVALGPSTALYGANAHSGVVNITSKSPAKSQGLDISV